MARHYRYTPSTVDTITWTISCGAKKHRVHLVRGRLLLPHHPTHEIQTAILRHHLGEDIRPCMALLIALKARCPTLAPPLIPKTVQEALCTARFARRTVDYPVDPTSGFSATTLTTFFHPVSQRLKDAGLSQARPSSEFRVPSLHLKGFTRPLLVKHHGRWEMPADVIPELTRAISSQHTLTALFDAIAIWITSHQPAGDAIHG